jgi:hypothetical protein
MDLFIDSAGGMVCIYAEEIDLGAIGNLTITRASHVEADGQGRWWADMAPCGGPILGPFTRRSEALAAETRWLSANLGSGHER